MNDPADHRRSAVRRGDPVDVLIRDGVIAEIGSEVDRRRRDRSTATGWSCCPGSSTCTPTCANPAARTSETIATGSAAAALGGYTAVFAMPNTRPGRRHRGASSSTSPPRPRRSGWSTCTRSAPSPSGSRARSSPSWARWPRGRGADVLRRRPLRARPADHAPGAGVRHGAGRGDRPARRGPPAHRGRAGARGRGRRPGSGWPGWPAAAEETIVARDCALAREAGAAAARLPRLVGAHRRRAAARPRRRGVAGHRRGHPAPPAAHRRAR